MPTRRGLPEVFRGAPAERLRLRLWIEHRAAGFLFGGKVEQLELFPLCFEEFVMATQREPLLDAFRSRRRNASAHAALWSLLLDYYFVGGMPEAVAAWFEPEASALARAEKVAAVHRNLVNGYRLDFGKYAGRQHAHHIERIFDNVPVQLALNRDSAVARYRFKGVLPRQQRYRELAGPIDWLQSGAAGVEVLPRGGPAASALGRTRERQPVSPVLLRRGSARTHAGMTATDHRGQGVSYKGYIAENFVQTGLCARVGHPTYGWFAGRAKVEFLHRCRGGEVVPVDVKSGSRTRARSLRFYIDRYAPSRAIKLIGTAGSRRCQ